MIIRKIIVLLFISGIFQIGIAQSNNYWSPANMQAYRSQRTWLPELFFTCSADIGRLKSALSSAPVRSSVVQQANEGVLVAFPMPDGSYQTFSMLESPIMEVGLAEQFPDIKTYAGYSLTDPTAYMRCSFTVWGFHGFILSQSGTVYIDPFEHGNIENYICYYKKDISYRADAMRCIQQDENEKDGSIVSGFCPLTSPDLSLDKNLYQAYKSFSGTLRTYRLALACTGEYAAKFGGTANGAMGGMVVSMNRVNGIYEKELNVHMNLITNNLSLIYIDAATDPYSNNNGSSMLSQNQINVDNIIGVGNYDIGHVFSTGGGGIAMLGCVCTNGWKAQGVTGSPNPTGDPFDVDYVAHEMGHQFGGNHTFNANTGSCSGNRVGSSAYEPGSGSTIMAYAGICDANDIQNNSDAYFNTRSFDEIVTFLTTMGGNSCPVTTPTNNQAPQVTLPAVTTYTIPAKTPFKLSATAIDPDNDPVTYCWEQIDTGPAGAWNTPTGNAPLFRSYTPVINSERMFPQRATILLGNQLSLGEILPTYARTMKFRCTARDNKSGGGGISYHDTPITLEVVATANPFRVNTGNVSGLQWIGASMRTITWDVVGTDQPPVNTPFVNIYLSLDGGLTFPHTLASSTPNDGSEQLYIPNISTTKARIMIEGEGNVFFDINDKDFSILINAVSIATNSPNAQIEVYPNPGQGLYTLRFPEMTGDEVRGEVTDLAGRVILPEINIRETETSIDLRGFTAGIYLIRIQTETGSVIRKLVKE